MSHAYRSSAPLLLVLAGLSASVPTVGCGDNVSCVFTTGCTDDGGGSGPIATATAVLPLDGQWIETGPPRVSGGFPAGDVAPTTPIVLTFSESMNEATLDDAFTLASSGGQTQATEAVLVGDGRVLVLRPTMPLVEEDYTVEVAANAAPTDITGQELSTTGEVASFSVVDPAPSGPVLVTTWPPEGEAAASQTGQIVVAFDRPLDPASVDADSFDVTVDGADPATDPLAAPLDEGGAADRRVYTWQALGTEGLPLPLGTDVEVAVALSTGTDRLLDTEGDPLPATTVRFSTAPFSAPLGAGLLSTPADAIGLANLVAGSNELTVQVDLADGMVGDFVDLIFFGTDPEEPARLLAFLRSVQISGAEPIIAATFSRADVDFTQDGEPRVADGLVAFALRTRRGGTTSPLSVLDADPGRPGLQDLLLDTVAPTIDELFPGGAGGTFRSDQRGLVLSGRASEPISTVVVTSDVGDNLVSGNPAPAVGAAEDGSFVAAPVTGPGDGLLPTGPIACSAVVRDRAGNPSPAVAGSFSQHGAVAEAFAPGDTIDVEVFDALTLEPLQGALVATHADMGNGTDYPFSASGTTGAGGLASVASVASAATLLSVDLGGYDLFTLHGVGGARVSVGLWPVGAGASARLGGDVSSQSTFANLLTVLDVKVADSRLDPELPRTFPTGGCISLPGIVTCPFTPRDALPGRLGIATALVGDFLLGATSFAPDTLVQAFELSVPRPALDEGELGTSNLELPFFFLEAGLDPTEEPLEVVPTVLDAGAAAGIDLAMLEDDAATTGTPHVTLEALVPGVPGSAVVGLGLAFETSSGATSWNVRAAHPGAVTAGFYAQNGVVDPDLFLRAELRDAHGNRSLRRPRLSALGSLPSSGGMPLLELAPVAQVQLTGTDTSGGGLALDLAVDDVVSDASGLTGLIEVRLTDASGRSWRVWREDPPGSGAPVALRVPDLAPAGGSRLAAGAAEARVLVRAWPGFDPEAFLWSDPEREHDLAVVSEPLPLTIP